MAGFEVSLNGRFWVSPEGKKVRFSYNRSLEEPCWSAPCKPK